MVQSRDKRRDSSTVQREVASDFVLVRLSAHGQKIAAGVPLRVHGGRQEFEFSGDTPQKVTKAFDFDRVLAPIVMEYEDVYAPVFEIAEAKGED